MFQLIKKALSNLFSPPFFIVLAQSLGLTLGLFIALYWLLMGALGALPEFSWAWVNSLITILTSVGLFVGFIFLLFPVAAVFIGLFLETVAAAVEKRDYPHDPPARGLSFWAGLGTAVKFLFVVIAVNLVLLPVYFLPGINVILLLLVNGYLIGREYFELVALRYLSPKEVTALRRAERGRVILAGIVIASGLAIPIINLFAPLFGTALMVHLFKEISFKG